MSLAGSCLETVYRRLSPKSVVTVAHFREKDWELQLRLQNVFFWNPCRAVHDERVEWTCTWHGLYLTKHETPPAWRLRFCEFQQAKAYQFCNNYHCGGVKTVQGDMTAFEHHSRRWDSASGYFSRTQLKCSFTVVRTPLYCTKKWSCNWAARHWACCSFLATVQLVRSPPGTRNFLKEHLVNVPGVPWEIYQEISVKLHFRVVATAPICYPQYVDFYPKTWRFWGSADHGG